MQEAAAKSQTELISTLETRWDDDTIMEIEYPEAMIF